MEGRLMQVKLYSESKHINILGFYQQAWQQSQVQKCMKKREQLLNALNNTLQHCSHNQPLILAGDFNTELPPVWPRQTCMPKQPDWMELQALMQRRRLCALNMCHKWEPTFSGMGPSGTHVETRIDYIMT